MKVNWLFLLAFTTLAPAPAAQAAPAEAAPAPADTLTVVTLNIWHDQRDWPKRLARIVAGLRALRPDVVCLQEVLQHATLPNQALTLADSLGFRAHFVSVDSVTRVKRYGNAILTPHPVLHQGGRALLPFDDYRVAAHVRLDFHGRVVDVYDTHLHHTPEGAAIRAAQVRDLLAFIDSTGSGGPLVLAGDFNAEPDALELEPLLERFTDVFGATNPGVRAATMNPALGNASRRIDHIFTPKPGRQALVPLSARILFTDPGADSVWASDHFGVVARFGVGAGRGAGVRR